MTFSSEPSAAIEHLPWGAAYAMQRGCAGTSAMTCARNSSKALPSEEGLLGGNGSFCSNILSRLALARETRLFTVPMGMLVIRAASS
jgi:hypothetical protein